jgi:hypothetical protein
MVADHEAILEGAHMPIIFLLLLTFTVSAQAQPMRVEILRNPSVTQQNIDATICVPGWTKGVRPPSSYTHRIKLELLHELEIPQEQLADYELDHRIPLSLGGAPADPRNLELQPWDEAEPKDRKEACLARAVCAGVLKLEEAQQRIWSDWRNVGAGCD